MACFRKKKAVATLDNDLVMMFEDANDGLLTDLR